MKKLTIIMPFLNEGYEPINTIISINNTTDPTQIQIIAICDSPEYEYEEQITQFPNVIFVKNKQKIGVDASRSVGINLAQTDAVLIIDAHMRFSNDDWVDKIYDAVMSNQKTLWCTRSVVLHNTMTIEELDPLKDVLSVERRYSVGAKLYYQKEESTLPFHLKWAEHSSFLTETNGYVSCILGANYAGSTQWLQSIRSFEGMLTWGFSEQYVSIKNWLLGGDCRGLDSVSIGHIFRRTPPFVSPFRDNVHNMLFTAYTLFSDELDIFTNYISLLSTHHEYENAMKILDSRWDIVNIYRNYFLPKKTQKLTEYFDKFNIQYK